VRNIINAVARDDTRTPLGLPVGGAFIAYLLSARVRRQFDVEEVS
jgi:hypothetical protein